MTIRDIANKKIAVNCKTEDEAKRFVEMAYANGFKYIDGSVCMTNYHTYGKGTCYVLDYWAAHNVLSFGNEKWFKEQRYKVIPFSEIAAESFNIEVKRKKNKTIAVLKDGNGKYIRHAVAECSPDDTYDFEIGKKIALQRLFQTESKDCSNASDKGIFLRSVASNLLYGKVGDPTNLQAYGNIPLFVEDVVELFNDKGKSRGLISISKSDLFKKYIVMGICHENFTNGISQNGWLIVKRKSFSEMKDGDIIDILLSYIDSDII